MGVDEEMFDPVEAGLEDQVLHIEGSGFRGEIAGAEEREEEREKLRIPVDKGDDAIRGRNDLGEEGFGAHRGKGLFGSLEKLAPNIDRNHVLGIGILMNAVQIQTGSRSFERRHDFSQKFCRESMKTYY